jgi:hypothetical protein
MWNPFLLISLHIFHCFLPPHTLCMRFCYRQTNRRGLCHKLPSFFAAKPTRVILSCNLILPNQFIYLSLSLMFYLSACCNNLTCSYYTHTHLLFAREMETTPMMRLYWAISPFGSLETLLGYGFTFMSEWIAAASRCEYIDYNNNNKNISMLFMCFWEWYCCLFFTKCVSVCVKLIENPSMNSSRIKVRVNVGVWICGEWIWKHNQ